VQKHGAAGALSRGGASHEWAAGWRRPSRIHFRHDGVIDHAGLRERCEAQEGAARGARARRGK